MAVPRRSRGHASTRWYLHCPYCQNPLPDHLLSAVSRTLAVRPENDRDLESAVERNGHARERRVRLPCLRIGGERVGVREHVVGYHHRARLDLRARNLEQPLVVVLLRVEED